MNINDLYIKFLDSKGKFLEQVKNLGDKNSKTLGTIPYMAYDEAVSKRNIIIAMYNDNVVGYILFRKVIKRNQIVIVQFCIDNNFREEGIGYKLFLKLKKNSIGASSIQLKCRHDYSASSFWPKLGFHIIKTMPGRKKSGSILNLWYQKLDTNGLFDLYYQPNFNKLPIVLDSNIIIDLYQGKSKTYIFEDWIDIELEYCITPEFFNEINLYKNSQEKVGLLDFAKKFKKLETSIDFTLIEKIGKIFSQKSKSNIEKDIRHLNHVILSNIKYFITNDYEDFIKRKEMIASEFGIKILTPEMLISELDQLEHPEKYVPSEIGGTGIREEVGIPDLFDTISAQFYNTNKNEKKKKFEAIIKQAYEHPDQYNIRIFSKESIPLSLVVEYKTEKESIIKMFRIANNKKNYTIQHLILDNLVDKYSKEKIDTIIVDDSYMDIDDDAFQSSYFIQENGKWKKQFKYGIKDTFESADFQVFEDYSNQTNIERFFWPLKLANLNINCYIVPIHLKWAIELFAKKLASETLFEHHEEKLLSRENVYYCNSSVKIQTPARIIWYIPNDKQLDSKFLGYSSYVDESFQDFPKVLYKNFERLGIYKWNDVFDTAKRDVNKKIKAFIFRDTEEFKKKIYFKQFKNIYEKEEAKGLNVQSIIKIDSQTYIELYKVGMKYE